MKKVMISIAETDCGNTFIEDKKEAVEDKIIESRHSSREIHILCKGTKIIGMTITDIPVKSEFNRSNVIKAIQEDKPEIIETVWESITKNIVKDLDLSGMEIGKTEKTTVKKKEKNNIISGCA